MIASKTLQMIDGIRHGFFTREGGRSSGVYASLNTGLGSDDDKEAVLSNRRMVAEALGAVTLFTPYQVHSPDAVVVEEPWDWRDPPQADACVTRQRNVALAINTADCTPVLFASGDGEVVGAAHAGWKGALGGVLEATVARMEELGANRADIHAAVGPTISRTNYEVGPEFYQRFVDEDEANRDFFSPSQRENRYMFDLPGFVTQRLSALGVASVEDLELCTYGDEQRFYSYRRMTHRNEPDYGRQMSAIVIAG